VKLAPAATAWDEKPNDRGRCDQLSMSQHCIERNLPDLDCQVMAEILVCPSYLFLKILE
jgi:hypothetical protein